MKKKVKVEVTNVKKQLDEYQHKLARQLEVILGISECLAQPEEQRLERHLESMVFRSLNAYFGFLEAYGIDSLPDGVRHIVSVALYDCFDGNIEQLTAMSKRVSNAMVSLTDHAMKYAEHCENSGS